MNNLENIGNLQCEFSREFFKYNFRQFAATSKCRLVRPAPLATPLLGVSKELDT